MVPLSIVVVHFHMQVLFTRFYYSGRYINNMFFETMNQAPFAESIIIFREFLDVGNNLSVMSPGVGGGENS